jgi:protein-S-isoprenylcysteine O-methyltransferase Ste14
MSWVIRQTVAVLILPVTVVVVAPVWIARAVDLEINLSMSSLEWVTAFLGLGALVAGSALFLACVMRCGVEGKGTLAPWDPPGHLVASGPYAYVRNPMISGVILVLLAEGLLLRSVPHVQWAGIFFLINATYIPLVEEPLLKAKFGQEYGEYRESVPRLIPRLRPWRGT